MGSEWGKGRSWQRVCFQLGFHDDEGVQVRLRVPFLLLISFRLSVAFSSDTTYVPISFRKSTRPQNRQLDIVISNSEQ